jgi:broad specificity phosphatase PhoE
MRRPLWFVHKARRGLVPGDEPTDRMGGRIIEAARRLAREHPGEPAALVSHADPLQAAWVLLDGRPQNEREIYRKQVERAGMLVIDLDEDGRALAVNYEGPPKPAAEPQAAAPAA